MRRIKNFFFFYNCNLEKLIIERHSTPLLRENFKLIVKKQFINFVMNMQREANLVIENTISIEISTKDNMTFCCPCQWHKLKDKREVSMKSHHPEIRKGYCAMIRI
ncbi:hypothetical protein Pfo_027479 [Paulownia fortunei]|nr:hypothetical protein Pfo_027479 [Paulownia fortunei]